MFQNSKNWGNVDPISTHTTTQIESLLLHEHLHIHFIITLICSQQVLLRRNNLHPIVGFHFGTEEVLQK